MIKTTSNITIVNIFILFFICIQAKSQISNIEGNIELQGIGTTNKVVPFWMRSNQFGSIPNTGLSTSIIGRINRNYVIDNAKRALDWGFALEVRENVGSKLNTQVIESYAKVKLSIFQLKIGRAKDAMGINGDTLMSLGNFSVSGNSLGIPKIELSIPEYYTIPILDGLFAFKGTFSHGYLGRIKVTDSVGSLPPNKNVYYMLETNPISYFHQKSFYGRLGKPTWKLKVYGGFNHQVYWGNENKTFGDNYRLSQLETFFYVATGKAYGTTGVPRSKIGNQLGSIDLSAEYEFKTKTIAIYRQNFYDVGALSKLANIRDGLNGIVITNQKIEKRDRIFKWKKILLEHFYSKDQAGYPWSKSTKSGDEDYYNNFFYVNGWSYKGLGVGSPIITQKADAREGQASHKNDYFINNRVIAWHIGFEGEFLKFQFTTKMTYSKNYGTYATSIYGNSTGNIRNPQTKNLFESVNQSSFYLNVSRKLKDDILLKVTNSVDIGRLLNNSYGFLVGIRKDFIIK